MMVAVPSQYRVLSLHNTENGGTVGIQKTERERVRSSLHDPAFPSQRRREEGTDPLPNQLEGHHIPYLVQASFGLCHRKVGAWTSQAACCLHCLIQGLGRQS